jgi:hypothetical protein
MPRSCRSSLVTRHSSDLLGWLIPQTMQFPKSQRFVMAQRLQDAALELHELLIAAGKSVSSPCRSPTTGCSML